MNAIRTAIIVCLLITSVPVAVAQEPAEPTVQREPRSIGFLKEAGDDAVRQVPIDELAPFKPATIADLQPDPAEVGALAPLPVPVNPTRTQVDLPSLSKADLAVPAIQDGLLQPVLPFDPLKDLAVTAEAYVPRVVELPAVEGLMDGGLPAVARPVQAVSPGLLTLPTGDQRPIGSQVEDVLDGVELVPLLGGDGSQAPAGGVDPVIAHVRSVASNLTGLVDGQLGSIVANPLLEPVLRPLGALQEAATDPAATEPAIGDLLGLGTPPSQGAFAFEDAFALLGSDLGGQTVAQAGTAGGVLPTAGLGGLPSAPQVAVPGQRLAPGAPASTQAAPAIAPPQATTSTSVEPTAVPALTYAVCAKLDVEEEARCTQSPLGVPTPVDVDGNAGTGTAAGIEMVVDLTPLGPSLFHSGFTRIDGDSPARLPATITIIVPLGANLPVTLPSLGDGAKDFAILAIAAGAGRDLPQETSFILEADQVEGLAHNFGVTMVTAEAPSDLVILGGFVQTVDVSGALEIEDYKLFEATMTPTPANLRLSMTVDEATPEGVGLFDWASDVATKVDLIYVEQEQAVSNAYLLHLDRMPAAAVIAFNDRANGTMDVTYQADAAISSLDFLAVFADGGDVQRVMHVDARTVPASWAASTDASSFSFSGATAFSRLEASFARGALLLDSEAGCTAADADRDFIVVSRDGPHEDDLAYAIAKVCGLRSFAIDQTDDLEMAYTLTAARPFDFVYETPAGIAAVLVDDLPASMSFHTDLKNEFGYTASAGIGELTVFNDLSGDTLVAAVLGLPNALEFAMDAGEGTLSLDVSAPISEVLAQVVATDGTPLAGGMNLAFLHAESLGSFEGGWSSDGRAFSMVAEAPIGLLEATAASDPAAAGFFSPALGPYAYYSRTEPATMFSARAPDVSVLSLDAGDGLEIRVDAAVGQPFLGYVEDMDKVAQVTVSDMPGDIHLVSDLASSFAYDAADSTGQVTLVADLAGPFIVANVTGLPSSVHVLVDAAQGIGDFAVSAPVGGLVAYIEDEDGLGGSEFAALYLEVAGLEDATASWDADGGAFAWESPASVDFLAFTTATSLGGLGFMDPSVGDYALGIHDAEGTHVSARVVDLKKVVADSREGLVLELGTAGGRTFYAAWIDGGRLALIDLTAIPATMRLTSDMVGEFAYQASGPLAHAEAFMNLTGSTFFAVVDGLPSAVTIDLGEGDRLDVVTSAPIAAIELQAIDEAGLFGSPFQAIYARATSLGTLAGSWSQDGKAASFVSATPIASFELTAGATAGDLGFLPLGEGDYALLQGDAAGRPMHVSVRATSVRALEADVGEGLQAHVSVGVGGTFQAIYDSAGDFAILQVDGMPGDLRVDTDLAETVSYEATSITPNILVVASIATAEFQAIVEDLPQELQLTVKAGTGTLGMTTSSPVGRLAVYASDPAGLGGTSLQAAYVELEGVPTFVGSFTPDFSRVSFEAIAPLETLAMALSNRWDSLVLLNESLGNHLYVSDQAVPGSDVLSLRLDGFKALDADLGDGMSISLENGQARPFLGVLEAGADFGYVEVHDVPAVLEVVTDGRQSLAYSASAIVSNITVQGQFGTSTFQAFLRDLPQGVAVAIDDTAASFEVSSPLGYAEVLALDTQGFAGSPWRAAYFEVLDVPSTTVEFAAGNAHIHFEALAPITRITMAAATQVDGLGLLPLSAGDYAIIDLDSLGGVPNDFIGARITGLRSVDFEASPEALHGRLEKADSGGFIAQYQKRTPAGVDSVFLQASSIPTFLQFDSDYETYAVYEAASAIGEIVFQADIGADLYQVLAEDVPSRLAVQLDMVGQTFFVDPSSPVGSLEALAVSDMGLGGSKYEAGILALAGVPQVSGSWTEDGTRFVLNAAGSIASVAASVSTSASQFGFLPESEGDYGYMLEDQSVTLISARIRNLQLVDLDFRDKEVAATLVTTTSSPFFAYYEKDFGASDDTLVFVEAVPRPASMTLASDGESRLEYAASAGVNQLTFVGQLGVKEMQAVLQQVPARIQIALSPDQGAQGLVVTPSQPLGSLSLYVLDPQGLADSEIAQFYVELTGVPGITASFPIDHHGRYEVHLSQPLGRLLATASTSSDPTKLFVLQGDHVFLRDHRDIAEPSGWLRTASAAISGVQSLVLDVSQQVKTVQFSSSGAAPFCAVADAIAGRVRSGASMTDVLEVQGCVLNRPASMTLAMDPKKSLDYTASSVISSIDMQVVETPQGSNVPSRFATLSVDGVPRHVQAAFDTAAGSLGFDTDTALASASVYAYDVAGLSSSTNPPVRHAYASVTSVPTKALMTWQPGFKSGSVSFDGQAVGRISAGLATTADPEDLRLFAGNHAAYLKEGTDSWLSFGVSGIRGGSWNMVNGMMASVQSNGLTNFTAIYDSVVGAVDEYAQLQAFNVPASMTVSTDHGKRLTYDASSGSGTRLLAFGNLAGVEFEGQIDGLPTHVEAIMDPDNDRYSADVSGAVQLVYLSASDPTGLFSKPWKRGLLLIEGLPSDFTLDVSDMQHLSVGFPTGSVGELLFFLTTMPEGTGLLYQGDHVVMYDNSQNKLPGNPSFPAGEWIGGRISGFQSFSFESTCTSQALDARFSPGGQPVYARYVKDSNAPAAGSQKPQPPPAARCPGESNTGMTSGDETQDIKENLDYFEAYMSNLPATTHYSFQEEPLVIELDMSASIEEITAFTTLGPGDVIRLGLEQSPADFLLTTDLDAHGFIDITQSAPTHLSFATWKDYENNEVAYVEGSIGGINLSWHADAYGRFDIDTDDPGVTDILVGWEGGPRGQAWGLQVSGSFDWDQGCIVWFAVPPALVTCSRGDRFQGDFTGCVFYPEVLNDYVTCIG